MHFHGSVVTECLEIAEPGGFLVSRLSEGEVLSLWSDRIDEWSHLEDHLRAVLARCLHGDPSQDLRNIVALDGGLHPGIGTRGVRTRNSQHHKAVLEVNLEICRLHVLIPDVQIGRIACGGDRAAHKHPTSHHIPWKAHIDLVLGRAVKIERLSAGRIGNLLHQLLVRGLLLLRSRFLSRCSLRLSLFLLFLKHGRCRVCGRDQQCGGDQSQDNTPFCHRYFFIVIDYQFSSPDIYTLPKRDPRICPRRTSQGCRPRICKRTGCLSSLPIWTDCR